MSLEWSKRVWKRSSARGVTRLVLLALADFADDRGRCFPSQARLARMANTSIRSVYEALKGLQEKGEVFILPHKGPRGCLLYQLTLTEESSRVEETSTVEGSSIKEGGAGKDLEVSSTTPGSLEQNVRNTGADEPSGTAKEPLCAQEVASPRNGKSAKPWSQHTIFAQHCKPEDQPSVAQEG